MRTNLIYHLIPLLIVSFQSCQDSRLYPDDEASTAQIREVANAMMIVGSAIHNYEREVQDIPGSMEALEQRGYLLLDPEFRSQWNLYLNIDKKDHIKIEAISTERSPLGKDLKLIYDYTNEKWKRPYKIR